MRIGGPFVGMEANGVMYVLPADVVFTTETPPVTAPATAPTLPVTLTPPANELSGLENWT